MGTYPANHYPFAVYRPEVDKTFFCYGGTDPNENTLWHEVGVYDHKTKKVSRPTVLVDKETEDAHDNPVMTMDDEGRIWASDEAARRRNGSHDEFLVPTGLERAGTRLYFVLYDVRPRAR